MKANEYPISAILAVDKKYFVPPYQRSYKWDAENAEQLIRDVHEGCNSPGQEYFIGSLICIPTDKGYEIVDGQQRLITLTLIMLELKKLLTEEKAKLALESRILSTNPFSKDTEPVPTISVRKAERAFYLERILREDDKIPYKTDPQKVFVNNQKAIGEYLSGMGQDELNRLALHLLDNVYVVFVEVSDRPSSFRMFNVLNNRGMSLNDADLLKNILLEKVADDSTGSALVESTWQDIENLVGEEKLDDFLILHQISEKKDRNRVKKKNFDYYDERLSGGFRGNSVRMSSMLLRSAENYGLILGIDGAEAMNPKTKSILAFLNGLTPKKSEWIPALLAFLNNGSNRDKFPDFVNLFERVYMHGWLTGLRPSQRDAASYYAIEAINKGESFEKIMASVRDRANNELFEESLDSREFYDGSRPQIINLVKSVLLRVDRARYDDSAQVTYHGRITVEHILPQKMDPKYWKGFTSADHEEWLHKLGNLTLVSGWKNSAAKNFGFTEKKKAYAKSNQKCSFGITEELCNLPDWNMEALQKRHEKLKEEIKKLWWVDSVLF